MGTMPIKKSVAFIMDHLFKRWEDVNDEGHSGRPPASNYQEKINTVHVLTKRNEY